MKKTASISRSRSSQRRKKPATKRSNRRAGTQKSSRNGMNGNRNESLLENFFINQLKDIYYAELKIVQSLPTMIEAATTFELREAFEDHRQQTRKHAYRLEKIFEMLGKKAEGKKCDAIEGIIKEAESIIEETEDGTMTRDAALIMAAQKVEHYEIASYGGLVQFALTMGIYEIADILDRTLREEEITDGLLTDIAERFINLESEQEGKQYSWNLELTM
jgi:ferritin-like metal-binding protein YciE